VIAAVAEQFIAYLDDALDLDAVAAPAEQLFDVARPHAQAVLLGGQSPYRGRVDRPREAGSAARHDRAARR
jgi:hypothetical protein